jgi:TPR repeat protein
MNPSKIVSCSTIDNNLVPTSKAQSSAQGRTISKVPENKNSSWFKKALLIAAVVASIFVLSFAIAVTAGLSGATFLGISGLAKSITSSISTGGTYALLSFSYLGSLVNLSYAILGLWNLNSQTAKEEAKPKTEQALSKVSGADQASTKEEVKLTPEKILKQKEEAEYRKKMFSEPFEAILAEKKPSLIAIQVFFENVCADRTLAYIYNNQAQVKDRQSKLLNLFSKTSPVLEERAAWATLNIWIKEAGSAPKATRSEAAIVLEEAAQSGSALANYLFAGCLAYPCGFKKDLDKAFALYEFAANKNLACAMLKLAYFNLQKQLSLQKKCKATEPDYFNHKIHPILPEAAQYIHSAAKFNLPAAQAALGDLYLGCYRCPYNSSCFSYEPNLELAKHYLQLAVDQNYSPAFYSLAKALLYPHEIGKPNHFRNPAEAITVANEKDETQGLLLMKRAVALGYDQAKIDLDDYIALNRSRLSHKL